VVNLARPDYFLSMTPLSCAGAMCLTLKWMPAWLAHLSAAHLSAAHFTQLEIQPHHTPLHMHDDV
jgi:hypothetical protein